MTRPRRVLTVVVERCVECEHGCAYVDGVNRCNHPTAVETLGEGDPWSPSLEFDPGPPPEWCPLPCEPSGKSGQLEEP